MQSIFPSGLTIEVDEARQNSASSNPIITSMGTTPAGALIKFSRFVSLTMIEESPESSGSWRRQYKGESSPGVKFMDFMKSEISCSVGCGPRTIPCEMTAYG